MASDRQLALSRSLYGYQSSSAGNKPSALLNSIFMSTVNTAAKTLVSVASKSGGTGRQVEKWKPSDHLRFMVMMTTWLTVWVLRVLMDHLPFSSSFDSSSSAYSSPFALSSFVNQQQGFGLGMLNQLGSFHELLASSSSSVLSTAMSVFSPASSAASAAAGGCLDSSSSLDLVLSDGSDDVASVKALGRALTNIFALLNEIPASSRKYQFAVAMADKIVDENVRGGHVELLQINRTALASAFARTSELVYGSLQTAANHAEDARPWVARVVKSLPLGSYVSFFMKGLGTVFPSLETVTGTFYRQKQLAAASEMERRSNELAAEKHAQELLWITNKMRGCGAVDEALVQWSWASALASLSLTANPRVQGLIVKISAILIGEMGRPSLEDGIPDEVKFRVLALWIPLFCYAENGLSYPVLSGFEKAEMERIMNELITSLPSLDQEVILTNWLQDFTSTSSSDWPNLQVAYDKWCHSTRNLVG